MHFKLMRNSKGMILYAKNVNLDKRWSVENINQMSELTGTKWNWFGVVFNRTGERTKLHCGYDSVVKRPVIIKTMFYRANDLTSFEAIENRREVLREQIRILNDINSPLLPEPLDWFLVENTVDNIPVELKDSEPVLVLDYIPGLGLETNFKKNSLRFKNDPTLIDVPRVGRIMLKFLQFLRVLDEKGYGFLDFRPDHVLFLKNDIPRFVGLGSICPVKADGTLDENHVNFSRTTKGYAAPELLNPANNWKSTKNVTPSQLAAYSLGVMLHQIIMENKEFSDGMIQNGSFYFPNGVSEVEIEKKLSRHSQLAVYSLIRDLCKEDPEERLTDYDEIEQRLHDIAKSILGKYRSKQKEQEAVARKRKAEEERREKQRREEKQKQENARKLQERLKQEAIRKKQEEDRKRKSEQQERERKEAEKQKKNGWCFLSTAAYGTPTHPNLDILRTFRDDVLMPVPLGRKMLAHYKLTSPKISHLLRGMPIRKKIVRKIIDLTVVTVRKSLQTGNSWGIWAYVSTVLYYIVFALSFVFVLPEKILGIETTKDRGENE